MRWLHCKTRQIQKHEGESYLVSHKGLSSTLLLSHYPHTSSASNMGIMGFATVLRNATITAAAIHATLLPAAEPTITRDPWQCATENITQYLDVPKPTGVVLTALLSYADELYKDCTITEIPTGTVIPTCPFPAASSWCAFSTVAPASILPEYSSYGSAASIWWASHSAQAVSVAQACPNSWYKMLKESPNGQTWLNDTIVFAGCYAEAHTTASGPPTSTAPLTISESTTSGPNATPTGPKTGLAGRMEVMDMFAAAGAGLVAATLGDAI
jgi:hypothetical protein